MTITDNLIELFYFLPRNEIIFNKYLVSLVIIILFAILGKLVLFVFDKYFSKISKKTKTKFDDMLVEHTKKPIFYFVLASGLKLAILNLEIINEILSKFIDSLMALVFILIIFRTIDIFIEVWGLSLAKKTKVNVAEVLLPIIHKTITVFFILVSILWVLGIWEINITPYLAGVGLSGIVLGLALQDTLKNVFGGISLIMDKNFNIGDPVRLESGELGKVQEIGLRSTKIITFDHEIIFIPNGQLANMKIHNYVKPNTKIRKIVEFSVVYGSDVKKVQKVVLDAMKKVEDIYDEPYIDVVFTKMGDYGLHFSGRFFVDWDNGYKKWLEMTDVIHSALLKAKIDIPYPTQTLYIKK